jgi:hypothetical protein
MDESRREFVTRMSERDAIAPQVTPRRRRSVALTLPSGLLVFVCAMMPTLRLCGSHSTDIAPGLLLPPLWPLYVLGLLIAITAVRRRRFPTWGWIMLGAIWAMCVACMMFLELFRGDSPAQHIAMVGGVLACVAMLSLHDDRELLVARASAVAAAALALTFGALAFAPGYLWGVAVACGASATLAAGCIWWWLEARKDGAL